MKAGKRPLDECMARIVERTHGAVERTPDDSPVFAMECPRCDEDVIVQAMDFNASRGQCKCGARWTMLFRWEAVDD